MASGRSRVRHSLFVNFATEGERAAFKSRLEHVRSLLAPSRQPNLDNNGLMAAMFDHVEQSVFPPFFPGSERAQSFNKNSGKLSASVGSSAV